MKLRDTLRRSGRSLRSAKIRTLLTAAALAVGGFTLTATLAAANGAKTYTDQLIASNFDPSALTVSKDKSLFGANGGISNKPQEYDPTLTSITGRGGLLVKQLTTSDITKLEGIKGVENVTPQYQVTAQYVTRPGQKNYTATLSLYNPSQKPQLSAGTAGANLKDGTVFLPNDYLDVLGLGSASQAVGKSITVQMAQASGQTKDTTYTIAGVTIKPATSLGNAADQILMSTNDIEALNAYANTGTNKGDTFLTASVHIKDGTNKTVLAAAKKAIEGQGYSAETVADTQKLLSQVINILQGIVLGFGVITLIASFFGVVNTQYISVLERTREIGLMKALGMSRRSVSRLFIIEATWIGFIGALLGSAIAVGAGTLLNPWISTKLGFGHEKLLIFKPIQIVILIAFLMLITTVAGLLPARKAARLDPIEALRTE
jgi:putative ABC transport system permease protein